MGKLLGSGLSYRQAKANYMPNDTVEGADLALTVGPAIEALMDAGKLIRDRLPLTENILDSILRNKPFEFRWDRYHEV